MTQESGPEAVDGGEAVGVPSIRQAVAAVGAVLGRPALVGELRRVGSELGRIASGSSTVAPDPRDRRFTDPAWVENPFFHRLAQTYLTTTRALDRLVEDFAADTTDHHAVERARFAMAIVAAAAAPTNLLPTNPAGLKRAFDTGGASMLRGARNLLRDVRYNGGLPATVDRASFVVGRDLAASPGDVVHREPMAELIRYAPTTEQVRERPVLIVPPPIGRFYFLDLRPGRSFVEFAVGSGLRTFLMSWANPGPEQGGWDLDDYASAVSEAIDQVRSLTGSPDVNVVGFCAGGIITAALLSHLAAVGDERVHSVTFGVTLLDFALRAPLGAFRDNRLLNLVGRRSRRAGVITAAQMGAAFTWMRPDELVFGYVINNWVLGNPPPVFDILAWNADGTNLPGALHSTFLDIFRDNTLTRPGGVSVLGTPVDLGRITVPAFITGAVADHLTPWRGCYRTTELLGGDPAERTFVLSHSGHIASLVNPPGNPKAHYRSGGPGGVGPDAWLEGATRTAGTWWHAWADWTAARSGDLVPAEAAQRDAATPELGRAPGSYVHAVPAP